MNTDKELEKILYEIYQEYLKKENNIPLTFEEWKQGFTVCCASCGQLILVDSFDILETEDGCFCGSCRP